MGVRTVGCKAVEPFGALCYKTVQCCWLGGSEGCGAVEPCGVIYLALLLNNAVARLGLQAVELLIPGVLSCSKLNNAVARLGLQALVLLILVVLSCS